MSKINYTDKVALNVDPSIAAINKCQATDMNSIKNATNENGSYTPLTIDTSTGVFYCNVEGTLQSGDIFHLSVPSTVGNVSIQISVDNNTTNYDLLYKDGSNVKPVSVSEKNIDIYFNGNDFILINKLIDILYNNTTGSNTSLTLSSSAANYKYLEIFFRSNDNVYNNTKVYDPNGKTVLLMGLRPTGTTTPSTVYLKAEEFKINGTSIENGNYVEMSFQPAGTFNISTNNVMYITKVIGVNE